MKEKIKKFGLPWIALYVVYFLCFIVVCIVVAKYVMNTTETFSITTYITPIFGMASLLVAMVTIRYNAVTNKEKNALEFVKEFKDKEIFDAMVAIYVAKRKFKKLGTNRLDRKKVSPFCERAALISPDEVSLRLSDDKKTEVEQKISSLTEELKYLNEGATKLKLKEQVAALQKQLSKSKEVEELLRFRSSLVKVLNVMERCANGVRYGLYDEGLIYNSYGNQFIEIYEMAFSFIKRRQEEEDKLFINAEWLAVKWTLQKEIREDRPTFMTDQKRAIQHANEGLKKHLRAPDKKQLEPLLSKMENLKFPR